MILNAFHFIMKYHLFLRCSTWLPFNGALGVFSKLKRAIRAELYFSFQGNTLYIFALHFLCVCQCHILRIAAFERVMPYLALNYYFAMIIRYPPPLSNYRSCLTTHRQQLTQPPGITNPQHHSPPFPPRFQGLLTDPGRTAYFGPTPATLVVFRLGGGLFKHSHFFLWKVQFRFFFFLLKIAPI